MATGSRDPVRPRMRATVGVLTMLGALWAVAASPAAASEVVDLRIGAHADFTRVVFELDRPTGYRIERASPEPGVQELVVSLDATSIPRKVHSEKSLIGLVRITPEGAGSVARIELRQDGLNLKEMILANPPRIVLDVLRPASQRAAKSAAKAKSPAKAKPAAQAKVAAPAPKKPAQVAKVKAPAPVARPPAPGQPKPAASPRPAAAAAPPLAPAATRPSGGAQPPVDRPAGVLPEALAAGSEPSEGGLPTMGMDMQGDPQGAPARRVPASAAERVARTATPPVTTTAAVAESDADTGMGTVAAVVGLVVLLAAGVVYMRRRGDSGIDDDDIDEGDALGAPAAATDDNPFSGLSAGLSSGLSDGSSSPPSLTPSRDSSGAVPTGGAFEIGGIGIEDDEEEKPAAPVDGPLMGDTGIALGDADALVQGVGSVTDSATAGLAGANEGDEEVMRMIGEFERRMASLESRLDEVVDARERLERQVAAQTEELRVQRAAIARTQRAVRNMNRPDEEGPTEPALRDPQ